MRITLKTLIACLCLALTASSSLYCNEESEQQKEHVQVGSRTLSQEEQEAIDQEAKKRLAEKASSKEEVSNEKSTEQEERITQNAFYHTSHSGAFHHAVKVSPNGEVVELIDGSYWIIRYQDRYKTLDWLDSDLLVISPNHTWFSSYQFRITNQNTGASVEANLDLGPHYNGAYTHWIIAIDHYNSVVYLEDGSSWCMSAFDSGVVGYWQINDTVIIGINDGWLSSTRPNILINVNMLNHSCGISSY